MDWTTCGLCGCDVEFEEGEDFEEVLCFACILQEDREALLFDPYEDEDYEEEDLNDD